MTNGELLAIAQEHGFDVLVTNDRSIYSQQNLRGRRLAIVVLPTNLRRVIMNRAADVVDTINRVKLGQYVVIELSGLRPVINYDAPEKFLRCLRSSRSSWTNNSILICHYSPFRAHTASVRP